MAVQWTGSEPGGATSLGRGLPLLPGGLELTRDVGVLQACRHLPLVHLELQGVHFVNVPRDSEQKEGVREEEPGFPTRLLSCPAPTPIGLLPTPYVWTLRPNPQASVYQLPCGAWAGES